MMVLLSGIEQLGFAQLARAAALEWVDGGRETLQRLQAPLLGSTMIGDDVIGDTQQPGQNACLLARQRSRARRDRRKR
jgi:hypothetical protein